MADTERHFKYDVAFSFLQRDEPLATKLNDLLAGRVTTFFYPRQQEDIAGTDGEATFNRVFSVDARIVVVLYRDGWGKTPFTRIEETAIRNRAFDEGYDFVLFIPLDTPPTVPKYLPKTRLWIGVERWGVEAAAAVIEARVQEAGGNPRTETAVEHASRLARDMDAAKRRSQFLDSDDGMSAMFAETARVIDAINDIADQSRDLKLDFENDRHREAIVRAKGYSISIALSIGGIPRKSRLVIVTWKGHATLRRGAQFAREVSVRKFRFDVDRSERNGWREGEGEPFYTSPELADVIVRELLDCVRDDQLGDSRAPITIIGADDDDD